MTPLRTFFSILVLAAGLVTGNLACGGGGGTATPPPAKGSLTLTVTGLPASINAAIALTGPASYSQNPTSTVTLTNLAPGAYTITASNVTTGGLTYAPSPASQTPTVIAGQTAMASVTYAPITGILSLTVTGLPTGTNATIAITGPASYSQNPTGTVALTNLAPGAYTITASNVTSGDLTYQPSSGVQALTVTAGQTTPAAVSYAPMPVSVSVSPTNPKVGTNGTVQLTAIVTGSSTTTVTWTVVGGAGSGSVSNTGLYTAPSVAGTYDVKATSVADATKASTATITVSALGGFRISPPSLNTAPGGSWDFQAFDDNTPVTTVTWSLPAAAGTVDTTTGHFVASSNLGAHILTGTNTLSLQQATATITIVNNVVFSLLGAPDQTHLLAGDGAMFFSDLSPSSGIDRTLTWSIVEGSSGGHLSDMGWYHDYFSPATPGTYTIRAVPTADVSQAKQAAMLVGAAPAVAAFSPTSAPPSRTRLYHAMATMADGRVVVAGGWGGPTWYYNELIEIYSPISGAFSSLARGLNTPRSGATLSVLDADRLLVCGGETAYDQAANTGEIINLTTGAVDLATGTLRAQRMGHQVTTLTTGPNAGRLLITGGMSMPNFYGTVTALADLFDPVASAFGTLAQNMQSARVYHTATRLLDGTVLIAGGNNGTSDLATAELYDPVTGTFAATTGSLAQERTYHTATLLQDGRVLIAGGQTPSGMSKTTEIYDPATGLFSVGPDMQEARGYHTATLLNDGRVLVIGGSNGAYRYHGTAEVFDPGSTTWAFYGRLLRPMQWHASVLLQDGHVMVIGDLDGSATPQAELSN